ncbi:MAG: single-stranded-DNA-specific exonuclease RecJ, partial [Deltaproteobacteria bacterium HGW-Deltaproteobacteria-23]
ERQEIEKEILADALEQLKSSDTLKNRTAVVLASEAWHPGVIGIVASRVVERCHRPTILIALQDGVGKGSGRSIPAFHLYNALAAAKGTLVKFGGHQQAAGISILKENLAAFYDLFDGYACENLSPEDLLPEYGVDSEIRAEDLGEELLAITNSLKPFGMGNPEPLFLLRGAKVVSCRILKDAHLKMTLNISGKMVDSIGFKMAGKVPACEFIDILFTPELNVWQGRENLQLRLRDIRTSGGIDGAE